MQTISYQNHNILENLPIHRPNRPLMRNTIDNSLCCDQITRIQEVGQTLQLKKIQHRRTGHHIHSGSIIWNEYGRQFISNNNDNCHGIIQHPVKLMNCCPMTQCNCYMDCSRSNYIPRIGMHRKYHKYNNNRTGNSTGNLICIQTQKVQNCRELIHTESSLHNTHGCKDTSYDKNAYKEDNNSIEERSHNKEVDITQENMVEMENSNVECLNTKECELNSQNESNEPPNSNPKKSHQVENRKTAGKGFTSRYIENVDLLRNHINNNHHHISNNNEKTPMCLLNDLARYNKIPFQYRLTNENGPAHCKKFAVTLKLGDEEYKAEGCKIKQAQHLAAKEAIDKTKYKHPVPKSIRRHQYSTCSSEHVTPTVELNALTMKMGQQTLYIFDSHTEVTEVKSNFNSLIENNNSAHNMHSAYNANLIYMGNNLGNEIGIVHRRQQRYNQSNFLPNFHQAHQQYHNKSSQHPSSLVWNAGSLHACLPTPCKITLLVGNQKFIGIGKTLQQAKHDAAAQALQVIKTQLKQSSFKHHEHNGDNANEIKSPISMVFEIANKRNMAVSFKVLREEGPAHMRKFTTACIVGPITAEAEGTGKKISKRKAAQKMLEELQKLPPFTPPTTPTKNSPDNSKKQLMIEENKTKNPKIRFIKGKGKRKFYLSNTSNPIRKLIEYHQNLNEAEPEFVLISDNPSDSKCGKRRQFVMEVRSKDHTAQGTGNSKRLAKLKAAKNLLIAMGLDAESSSSQIINDSELKINNAEETQENECTEANTQDKSLNDLQDTLIEAEETVNTSLDDKEVSITNIDVTSSNDNDSNSAKVPPTIMKSNESNSTNSTKNQPLMKDQLLYLANVLGFEVKFCDYPKGNHSEFLTIVMLSTTPPQICHGIGMNTEESQENAAKNSLKILSEMGINDT